jgi:hypothetical protein
VDTGWQGSWFLGSKSAKEVFNEIVALGMALVGGN